MDKNNKNKIEKYLIENEGGVSFSWGEDSVTSFDDFQGKWYYDAAHQNEAPELNS